MLQNVKMVSVLGDYSMSENKTVNVALAQVSECTLLSFPHKCGLLSPLLTELGKKCFPQINSIIPNARSV